MPEHEAGSPGVAGQQSELASGQVASFDWLAGHLALKYSALTLPGCRVAMMNLMPLMMMLAASIWVMTLSLHFASLVGT